MSPDKLIAKKIAIFSLGFLLFVLPLFAFAKSALIIVDMQAYFATSGGFDKLPGNQEKMRLVINAQMEAIQLAKKSNTPIIFLEYEGYEPTNKKLTAQVAGYPHKATFKKNTDGMLSKDNKYKPALVEHLKKHKIDTLVFTGANGGACVKYSITGAMDACYHVVALSPGIVDFNYKEFIYPFDDYHTSADFKPRPHCKSATFRQVGKVKDAARIFNGAELRPATAIAEPPEKPDEDEEEDESEEAEVRGAE